MSIKAAATTDTASLTTGLPNKYPITVMLWVYIPSAWTGSPIGYAGDLGSASDSCWALEFRVSGGNAQFGLYSSGGGDFWGTATISRDAWHSVAVTIASGGAVHTYIDATVDINSGTASSAITPTTFSIGASPDGNSAMFATSGCSLYSEKIWNAELTSGQITTEDGSYAPVLGTNLYDGWLLTSVATAGTASNNGHTLTTVTGWTNDSDPPAKGAAVTVAQYMNALEAARNAPGPLLAANWWM